jgi:uncharacterized RDD family membrane protein YckC
MGVAEFRGPHPQAAGRPLAKWWNRAGAGLLDGVLVALAAYVLLVAAHLYTNGIVHGRHATLIHLWPAAALWVVYAVALECRPGRRNGQTIGKQAADIRVARDDGKPVGLTTALLREGLGKAGPFALATVTPPLAAVWAIYVVADALWPLWDKQNRALHDRLAGTHVTNLR